MEALITVGINLLMGAALWGLGQLFKKRQRTTVGEIQDREVQISTYGVVKPILYGQCKVGLQLVAAQDSLAPYPVDQGIEGGKGATYEQMNYLATFAGILGIAPDQNVFGEFKLLKLWADTKLAYNILDSDIVTQGPWVQDKLKFYPGSDSQPVDPWISTGSWGVTAYRGRVFITVRNLNVTNFGNRIPTIRALIGPGTVQNDTMDMVQEVPGWWGDGENQERYLSLQIIQSADFSYVICGYPYLPEDPDGGHYFQKIDVYSGETLSQKFFDYATYSAPGVGFCAWSPTYGGNPFPVAHSASLDELGRVYTIGCNGTGKVLRLNSDTWEVEASSPVYPSDTFVADTGYTSDPNVNPWWDLKYTRVCKTPTNPYLWINTCSLDMGSSFPQAVICVNRETMANPVDESHWGLIFWGPYGSWLEEKSFGVDGNGEPNVIWMNSSAICVDENDGSCFVLWTNYFPITGCYENWLSRLYSDGSRNDVKISSCLSLSENAALMTYDAATDQLFIVSPESDEIFQVFNGELEYVTAVPVVEGGYDCKPWPGYSEDQFQQGTINGYLYWTSWGTVDDGYTRVWKLDTNTLAVSLVAEFNDDKLNNGMMVSMQYNPIKSSVFVEWYDDNNNDSVLKEVLVQRINPGYIDLGDIVYDLCRRAGMADSVIDVDNLRSVAVKGYVVNQDQSARDAIESLMEIFIFDAKDEDGKLVFNLRPGTNLLTIPEEDLALFNFGGERVEPLEIEMPEESTLPRKVEVHYPDSGRKHEINVQYFERFLPDTQVIKKINSPVLLNHGEAAQLAEKSMNYDWAMRVCTFSLGPKYAHLSPSDVVTIQRTEGSYRIMLIEAQKQGLLTKWKGIAEDIEFLGNTVSYDSSAEGVPGPEITEQVSYSGPSRFQLIDAPSLVSLTDNVPGVYLASGGILSDYDGATIYVSKDNGVSWNVLGTVTSRAITGIALNTLGDFDSFDLDESNSLTVRWDLTSDSLSGTTLDDLFSGNGIYLLVGNEIICAKDVVTQSEGVQIFGPPLIRGAKSTDYAMTGHITGERVVLLNTSTIFFSELDTSFLNVEYLYAAVSFGDTWENAVKKVFRTELSTVKPLSGVQARGSRDGSNNLTITWRRRDRLGKLNPFRVGIEVPMSESSEAYEVDILDGTTVVRTISGLSSHSASYTAAQQTSDGITPGDPVTCAIYQLSGTVGRGWPLEATV